MADLRYAIHGHISHPDGSEKVVGGGDDDRSTDDYELKQEADIAAHILDQPYDDNPDVTDLPPVLKSHDNVYNMAYLVNMDLAPLGALKDLEGVRHLQPQHKGPHVDFGKVSIASITGSPDVTGSDKANISSLVHEDDVGIEPSTPPEEIGSLSSTAMNPNGPANLPPMGPNDTTTINGIVYNSRGYEVCGQLNQHSKPCQRIGRCPFHGSKRPDGSVNMLTQSQPGTTVGSLIEPQTVTQPQPPPQPPQPQSQPQPQPQPQHQHQHQVSLPPAPSQNHASEAERAPILHPAVIPVKKAPYKQGWTKDEHIRFLNGLQIHGKGAWKEIAQIVGSRTPTQIQSHAQKYYLRQKQEVKNKRSIHDLSLEDLSEADNAQVANSRTQAAPIAPYASLTAPLASQNPQDPASNTLGMLFSSFYRGAPASGNTTNHGSSSEASTSSTVPPLVPYPHSSTLTFRTPPPPMAQPVFSSTTLHSNSLLPHLTSAHHLNNSLPPLSAPTAPLSHAPAAPIPTNLYSNWFSNTFSAPAGSKMFSLPDFGLDDEVTVGDGLGVEDMHQSSSSNSVRNLISINDDDHPPLTHHLPHPPYPHDDDDKLSQFSSSYMSIPTIPRIDEDSNELPPLTGSRKRHFIDDEKILHDTNGIREKFRGSPPHQQGVTLPVYLGTLNHSP